MAITFGKVTAWSFGAPLPLDTVYGTFFPSHRCYYTSGEPMYLEDALKDRLRTPGSFQLIEMHPADKNADGSDHFWIRFRADNGYGGKTIDGLSGDVAKDCSVHNIVFAGQ